jgi:hypothetical protein
MALKLTINVNGNHRSISLGKGAIELGCKHQLGLFLWVEGGELRDISAKRFHFIFFLVDGLLTHA